MRNLRSRWLNIGQVILHVFMDRDELTTSIKTQKRTKQRKRPIPSNLDRKLGQKETKGQRREKGGT